MIPLWMAAVLAIMIAFLVGRDVSRLEDKVNRLMVEVDKLREILDTHDHYETEAGEPPGRSKS